MNIQITKQKDFFLLILGKLVSLLESNMQQFALLLYVLAVTGSAIIFSSMISIMIGIAVTVANIALGTLFSKIVSFKLMSGTLTVFNLAVTVFTSIGQIIFGSLYDIMFLCFIIAISEIILIITIYKYKVSLISYDIDCDEMKSQLSSRNETKLGSIKYDEEKFGLIKYDEVRSGLSMYDGVKSGLSMYDEVKHELSKHDEVKYNWVNTMRYNIN